MNVTYLSLGSNLGDRAANIARAIEALGAHEVRVIKASSLYETEPVNVRGGGWFLNGAVKAETELMPRQLMQVLLEIERSLGRSRGCGTEASDKDHSQSNLKEPRTIDIDILLFGSSVIDTPELRVPHPRMAERRFVLTPLAEIAPEVRHPILQQTISELLGGTSDRSQVRPSQSDPRK
jgi:2-amino-4-hydroxy-6-hydroxymethyldihydropteridine diphosphokinase